MENITLKARQARQARQARLRMDGGHKVKQTMKMEVRGMREKDDQE